jgi:hypothetical protein
MKAASWLRRYAAHPDPATAATKLVALVVAGNGPFYPLYMLALTGRDRAGAWLTMLASPVFFLVPVISRRCPRAGRAVLPLIGIANTVWCAALFGTASGVGLFLLPCIVLAVLLSRPDENWLAPLVMGLAIGSLILLTEFRFGGLMVVSSDAAAALTRLNVVSVATLTGLVSLRLINILHPPPRQ